MITKERFEKVINLFHKSEEFVDTMFEHRLDLTESALYTYAGFCLDELFRSNFDSDACDVITSWLFEECYVIHDEIHNTDISIETVDELWNNYLTYHTIK